MQLTANFYRPGDERHRVTYMEVFFDLVYVFAVTQLSHFLLARPTIIGALQTALLLAMVWLVWGYTSWVTNWLDPERIPVRLMLVALMFAGLVMSAALPHAFEGCALWVGGAYAVMQVGRSLFAVAGLRGEGLQRNFQRILVWCLLSGAFAVSGGLAHGEIQLYLWLAAVGADLLGPAVGFYTPGLGRSGTEEWNIACNHFTERYHAFVLIALGESIVVIGNTLSHLQNITYAEVGAFAAAFAGAVALWWIYFDRRAGASAQLVARSADPGRFARSAYSSIHPIMIGGIIVTAAADERVITHPTAITDASTAWLILGGNALFLAGHAAFMAIVWRTVPWTRIIAIVALGLLGTVATSMSTLALSAAALAVVLLATVDRISGHSIRSQHAFAGDLVGRQEQAGSGEGNDLRTAPVSRNY
jgi:low temperature requirement protein LtrA